MIFIYIYMEYLYFKYGQFYESIMLVSFKDGGLECRYNCTREVWE